MTYEQAREDFNNACYLYFHRDLPFQHYKVVTDRFKAKNLELTKLEKLARRDE